PRQGTAAARSCSHPMRPVPGAGVGTVGRVSLDPTFLPAPAAAPQLPPEPDVVALAAALVDIPSVSHEERTLADAVEQALLRYERLEVLRDGNSVVARTDLARTQRVVIAGHLDTVPEAGNLPSHIVTVDGEE